MCSWFAFSLHYGELVGFLVMTSVTPIYFDLSRGKSLSDRRHTSCC